MEGFNVIVAHDGEQAPDYYWTNSIDLLLLDVMMPKKKWYRHIKSTSPAHTRRLSLC